MLDKMPVRIAGVTTESIVDGPGIRSTIYFQGCPHACFDCHNPDTWGDDGGTEITLSDLIGLLKLNPMVQGVTFSGGEPFQQAMNVAVLGKFLRGLGLSIWVYTGYTWEYLLGNLAITGFRELLNIAEVLVDGPFIRGQRDLALAYRGSSNQRLIKVKESLASGKIIPWSSSEMAVEC